MRACERTGDTSLSLTLDGGETCTARLSFVRRKYRKLPGAAITLPGGDRLRPVSQSEDRIDFLVSANGRLILRWEAANKS